MVVTCLSVLLKRSEEILSTPLLSQMLSFHFFNHYFKKKGEKVHFFLLFTHFPTWSKMSFSASIGCSLYGKVD